MKAAISWSQSTSYSQIHHTGKTVIVRAYRFSDFAKCVAAHKGRRPNVNEFDSDLPPSKAKDKDPFRERVKRYRKIARDQHHFVFGVFDKASDEYVGQVDLL